MKIRKIIVTTVLLFCIILFTTLTSAYENKKDTQNYDYDKIEAMRKYDAEKFKENNSLIAQSFNIDLNMYKEIKRNPKIIDAYIKLDNKRGDTVPGMFLDEENNKLIALKQDINEINYLFEFESVGDQWEISDIKTTKGKNIIRDDLFKKNTKTTTITEIDGSTHKTITIESNN